MVILAAFVGIPLLVTTLALISIKHQLLWLRLHQRPDRPLRPGLLHVMGLIAVIGFTCFLDSCAVPGQDWWRVALLGLDIVFILVVAGLKVGLRLSPLTWAWWALLVSLILLVPFLLVSSLRAVVR
jgi:hypothetical protein